MMTRIEFLKSWLVAPTAIITAVVAPRPEPLPEWSHWVGVKEWNDVIRRINAQAR